jgi:hypothetical protein
MIPKGKDQPKVDTMCDHAIICCAVFSQLWNWDEDYVIFVTINERQA